MLGQLTRDLFYALVLLLNQLKLSLELRDLSI